VSHSLPKSPYTSEKNIIVVKENPAGGEKEPFSPPFLINNVSKLKENVKKITFFFVSAIHFLQKLYKIDVETTKH
jgi:hypothetical protein